MILFNLRETLAKSPARRNKFIMFSFYFALALNILLWLILLIKFLNYPEYVVLRYNIYFGISDLKPWFYILQLPLIGLLVIFLNLLIALWIYLKNSLISYFLASTALFLNVALLASGMLLIYFNL